MAEVNIVASPKVGVSPLSVSFSSEVISGDFVRFHWDFGDGYTADTRDATHIYSTTGYHTVVLVATLSDLSTVTIVERALVRVGEVSFTAAPSSSDEAPTSVVFTNTSASPTGYEFTDWHWDFGDESLGSGLTGPSHIYGDYGNYNVTLTAKMRQLE